MINKSKRKRYKRKPSLRKPSQRKPSLRKPKRHTKRIQRGIRLKGGTICGNEMTWGEMGKGESDRWKYKAAAMNLGWNEHTWDIGDEGPVCHDLNESQKASAKLLCFDPGMFWEPKNLSEWTSPPCLDRLGLNELG